MSAKNCSHYANKIILAPMVKIGTLATRLLALSYGADLVYSEEVIDWRILRSDRVKNEMLNQVEYIDQLDGAVIFSTNDEEKSRVILQIGTSDPERALKVLEKVQDDVSGIDVNMGCPKEFSVKGGMGAALLKKPEKIKAILTTLVQNAKIPVTCKIRVLPTIEETTELALLIQSCGVSALAIHGRTISERPRHSNRNDFIKTIAEKLDIPIIANGGSKEINCYEDILKFKEDSGASSVMLARAGEYNVSIFRKEGKLDMDLVIQEYLKNSVLTNNPFSNTKYTIQGILRELQETPRGRHFRSNAMAIEDLCEMWNLQDFYKEKKLEWDEFKRKRRLQTSQMDECDEKGSDPKKIKLGTLIDSSITVVPDCKFIRGHYTHEKLPKTVLVRWSRIEGFKKLPKYTTELSDKKFHSMVEVGDRKFMSDLWAKSRKHAEQEAALACIQSLKITS